MNTLNVLFDTLPLVFFTILSWVSFSQSWKEMRTLKKAATILTEVTILMMNVNLAIIFALSIDNRNHLGSVLAPTLLAYSAAFQVWRITRWCFKPKNAPPATP